MVKELDAATRYRLHAKELRAIGDAAITARIGATLYKIAADYDRMAASLEAFGQPRPAFDALQSAQPVQ